MRIRTSARARGFRQGRQARVGGDVAATWRRRGGDVAATWWRRGGERRRGEPGLCCTTALAWPCWRSGADVPETPPASVIARRRRRLTDGVPRSWRTLRGLPPATRSRHAPPGPARSASLVVGLVRSGRTACVRATRCARRRPRQSLRSCMCVLLGRARARHDFLSLRSVGFGPLLYVAVVCLCALSGIGAWCYVPVHRVKG